MFEAGVGGALRRTHRFASYRARNRVLWGILRRSPIGFPQAQLPLLAWSWAADRMISRWIPRCDVFHGLTGVCLATARSAKQLGAAILIDQTTLHPSVGQREVLADCISAGVRPESCERLLPRMLIRREEREYELCDRIIVYSTGRLAQLSAVSLRAQGGHYASGDRSPAVRAFAGHRPRTNIPRLLCGPD
jgi:hypothetical protein